MELEKKLGRNPAVEVTLINRDNFSLFAPMPHEVAASDLDLTTIGESCPQDPATRPFLCGTGRADRPWAKDRRRFPWL